MPTQRAHGGAALQPINLVTPAFKGLNTENESALLGQEWATTLNNAIFDSAGRIAVRKGWDNQTATPAAVDFEQIVEFKKADGTSKILMVSSGALYETPSAPAVVSGAGVITNSRDSIVNFNDGLVVFDEAGLGIYDGSTFEPVTINSGTAPTSNIGMSAYGRCWGVDTDGKTIKYSALLDETRWDQADGAGEIDMSQVWPKGQDKVVAIAAFNGDLVVFGEDNICFWTDGQPQALGITPDNLYVADTISGVGAVSRHAMTDVQGDVWFLSQNGVVSIGRLIQEKSNPINNISTHNSGFTNELLRLSSASVNAIEMTYSPRENMVLLNFPGPGRQLYFNTLGRMEDGTYRMASWTSDLRCAVYSTDDQNMYTALSGTTGEVFTYNEYADDATSYDFAYQSGWLDFGPEVQQYLKMLKRYQAVMLVQNSSTVTFSWEYDFGANAYNAQATTEGAEGTEYNVGEFGTNGSRDPSDGDLVAGTDVSEYGGGLKLQVIPAPGSGTGQFIKVGISYDTANANFALQQLTLFAKIGRIA